MTKVNGFNSPGKYRKKPVTITAVQWDGTVEGFQSLLRFTKKYGNVSCVRKGEQHRLRYPSEVGLEGELVDTAPPFLVIETLEGPQRANKFDYIIRGVRNELYACKPHIFVETYEGV